MPLHCEWILPFRGCQQRHEARTPYADVVCSYAFHKAADLDKQGLRPLVLTAIFNPATGALEEGSVPMPIVAFLDDFVVLVVTKTPGAFRAVCSKALGIVADNLARRGMSINALRGKTEAVLTFHGSEAALERHSVFETSCLPIACTSPLTGDISIGVTPTYKHLGSLNSGPNRY